MPDFEKIIKAIETALKLIFGDQVPPWIFRSVGYILLTALILLGIWGLLFVLSKIKNPLIEEFVPLFYNAEEKATQHTPPTVCRSH